MVVVVPSNLKLILSLDFPFDFFTFSHKASILFFSNQNDSLHLAMVLVPLATPFPPKMAESTPSPPSMQSSYPSSPAPLAPITLQLGHPSERLLPAKAVSSAVNYVLANNSPGYCLQYGAEGGSPQSREVLATWLTAFYRRTIPPERIALTAGASQTLATVLEVFTDPASGYTKYAWLVEPTYFLATNIFNDAGLGGDKLRAVPENDEGVDTAAFERLLVEAEKEILRNCGGGTPEHAVS